MKTTHPAAPHLQSLWFPLLALLLVGCAVHAVDPPGGGQTPPMGAIRLSPQEALEVGHRVWRNESGGSVEGLTAWNAGEGFASMGIGHFIWYPAGVSGPFRESFPPLLRYLRSEGTALPPSLMAIPPCPWNSKEEFEKAEASARMREIRQFLADTVPQQAVFLAMRLERSLPEMLKHASASDRDRIRRNFHRVAQTPDGVYALIDYVNFKGEGTSPSERYNGEGWGLLQVLQGMSDTGSASDAFADSASRVLERRVRNAPHERNESRWLAGWNNRILTYR